MASYPWHWDFFFDKYPYTDFHELNLDWLIHAIKFWYKEVDYVREAIATGSEDGNKYYENPHSAGDLIWWRGEFYRLTKDVKAGDDIDCNSLEHISVEDLLDEEEAARKAADEDLQNQLNTEIQNRINGDTNLQNQLNTEIQNRINGDTNLQEQITSNDNDIANHERRITTLEECCKTVQGDITTINNNISNIDKRVTKNEGDITNIEGDINNIDNSIKNIINGTTADTNTLTQLTYHEWTGTAVAGGDTTLSTLFTEAYTKIQQIVADGGHAELVRMQIYGSPDGTTTSGLYATGFLNAAPGGYELVAVDDSTESGIAYIRKLQIQASGGYEDRWKVDGNASAVSYTRTTAITSGWTWQVHLIYQTANYISAS